MPASYCPMLKIMMESLVRLLLAVICCLACRIECLPLVDFIPFGPDNGDAVLEPSDDASATVALLTPIPFYGVNRTYVTIHTDGQLDLMENDQSSTFASVLAFSADMDTRSLGQVFYRETTDPDLLEEIGNITQQNLFPIFQQNLILSVFVATWFHIGHYDSNSERANTFQCLLATDGTNTAGALLYADGMIEWTTGDRDGGVNGTGGDPADVGFIGDNDGNPFFLPASNTNAVINLDTTSNVGIPGWWAFQVDEITISKRNFLCNPYGFSPWLPLACEVCGPQSPSFSIAWFHNSKELSQGNGTNITIANTTNLTERSTVYSEIIISGDNVKPGTYYCQVVLSGSTVEVERSGVFLLEDEEYYMNHAGGCEAKPSLFTENDDCANLTLPRMESPSTPPSSLMTITPTSTFTFRPETAQPSEGLEPSAGVQTLAELQPSLVMTITPPSPSNEDDDLTFIYAIVGASIGGVIGGVILAVCTTIVIGIGVCVYWKRKKRKQPITSIQGGQMTKNVAYGTAAEIDEVLNELTENEAYNIVQPSGDTDMDEYDYPRIV